MINKFFIFRLTLTNVKHVSSISNVLTIPQHNVKAVPDEASEKNQPLV